MNIWLLGVGLVGLVAAGFWYAVLLGRWSPGLRVAFLSKGEVPTRTVYLWVLVVLVGESFVVNAFPGNRGGFSVFGGVVVAFALSEVARWWHNRWVPETAAEPPTASFDGAVPRDDDADRPDAP